MTCLLSVGVEGATVTWQAWNHNAIPTEGVTKVLAGDRPNAYKAVMEVEYVSVLLDAGVSGSLPAVSKENKGAPRGIG